MSDASVCLRHHPVCSCAPGHLQVSFHMVKNEVREAQRSQESSSARRSRVLDAQSPGITRAGGICREPEDVWNSAQHRPGTQPGLRKGYLVSLGRRVIQSKEPWQTLLCNAMG